MLTIGFVGAGITGTALATRLDQQGYRIAAVSSRTLASAEKLAQRMKHCHVYKTAQEVADNAQFVFITTPDDVIGEVAARIRWYKGQSIVHCSGAHSIDIIESARQFGANTGCFHPLQTFASIEQAVENIPGATFAIEAEEPLLTLLKEMSTAMAGHWVILEANDKVLYHTAAVFACNYLVTLVKLATDLWQDFGVSREQAIKALLPLLRGTLSNIENVGLPNCLTGPIARGDLGTIKKHLEALEKESPYLLSTYKQLGLQTLPIALAKGKINSEKVQELQELLSKQPQGALT
jgi:predicted short-subunit dehydrogenase-like oxidoreductase (DUF2520 family)